MQFSDDSLQEFQRIWKQEYGTEITKDEALLYAERLIGLFKILLDIDQKPKGDLQ